MLTEREQELLAEILPLDDADERIASVMDALADGDRPSLRSPTGVSEWSLRAAGRSRGYRTRGRLR
jgi:hypothetical protein